MFSCTKSLEPPSVVSMVELIAMLVSSPRVGGQIASSRAVSSPNMVTMRMQVRMISRIMGGQRKVTVW